MLLHIFRNNSFLKYKILLGNISYLIEKGRRRDFLNGFRVGLYMMYLEGLFYKYTIKFDTFIQEREIKNIVFILLFSLQSIIQEGWIIIFFSSLKLVRTKSNKSSISFSKILSLFIETWPIIGLNSLRTKSKVYIQE